MIKHLSPLLFTITLFSAEQANNTPASFFNVIPRDIHNHIAQYLLYQEAIERIATSANLNGVGITKLSYKKFDLHLDNYGSLFLKGKKDIDSSRLFAAEGSTLIAKILSIGSATTMYEPKRQVVCVNISPNKKIVGFLVASYNRITEDFEPTSIHVVHLLQKKNQRELL